MFRMASWALAALGPRTSYPRLHGLPMAMCGDQLPFPSPRAAKQRRKGDRLVISCQEQTYWLVNKPPVSPCVVRAEEFSWLSKEVCVCC